MHEKQSTSCVSSERVGKFSKKYKMTTAQFCYFYAFWQLFPSFFIDFDQMTSKYARWQPPKVRLFGKYFIPASERVSRGVPTWDRDYRSSWFSWKRCRSHLQSPSTCISGFPCSTAKAGDVAATAIFVPAGCGSRKRLIIDLKRYANIHWKIADMFVWKWASRQASVEFVFGIFKRLGYIYSQTSTLSKGTKLLIQGIDFSCTSKNFRGLMKRNNCTFFI